VVEVVHHEEKKKLDFHFQNGSRDRWVWLLMKK
jgi:hypothetical protein